MPPRRSGTGRRRCRGNVEAQFRLAHVVGKGRQGLKQDYPTAIKLYEAAAAGAMRRP
jgi:TPR repeat protein